MVASSISRSLARDHFGTSSQRVHHIRGAANKDVRMTIVTWPTRCPHVELAPFQVKLCDCVCHTSIWRGQTHTIHGGGGRGSGCGCCGSCLLTTIQSVWLSMSTAFHHFWIANVSVGTLCSHTELVELQRGCSESVANGVFRLQACVWCTSRDAIWRAVLVTLLHFGGAMEQ